MKYTIDELLVKLKKEKEPVDFLYWCVIEDKISQAVFYNAFYWLVTFEASKAIKQSS